MLRVILLRGGETYRESPYTDQLQRGSWLQWGERVVWQMQHLRWYRV